MVAPTKATYNRADAAPAAAFTLSLAWFWSKKKKTGGGGKKACSLVNAMKHARIQHGPSSAEAHAKKVANATSAVEHQGQKRNYAAISRDDGDQKTAAELAKEKYDAAAEILAGFKGHGLRL